VSDQTSTPKGTGCELRHKIVERPFSLRPGVHPIWCEVCYRGQAGKDVFPLDVSPPARYQDNAEDLGGRRLPLQRFAQLAGGRRLRCDRLVELAGQQCDLLFVAALAGWRGRIAAGGLTVLRPFDS